MRIFILFILCFISFIQASIPVETEGMEPAVSSDGTYLTASPTYYYDRPSLMAGIHSQSELWSPDFLTKRLLVDRYSVLPSWQIQEPSIWMQVGNEIGDMIYHDVLTDSDDRPMNRTPMLEAGFRSNVFHGFFSTARFFQVDHFSSSTLKVNRKATGTMEYSLFGSNLPAFSTGYVGLGYSKDQTELSILAGREYLWLFGESGRWISALLSPRVESRFHYKKLDLSLIYEDVQYKDKEEQEEGTRKEWSGSLFFPFGKCCKSSKIQTGGGLAFRFVNDEGDTYFGLENDRAFWAFLQAKYEPIKDFTVSGHAGMNERDWLIQDSIQYSLKKGKSSHFLIGLHNLLGTRLNPMGESYEFFNQDTISLSAEGFLQLYQAKIDFTYEWKNVQFALRGSGFFEKGAETFDTTGFVEKRTDVWYRYGDVSRINSWIRGASAEMELAYQFKELFSASVRAGMERLWGEEERFEVQPSEHWLELKADWTINKTLLVSHSLHYRSDAMWNLRHPEPYEVPGDWFWNASFSQLFPKYGLSLTGTLLHVLSDEIKEVPNGNENRIRFFCNIKKTF